MLTFISCAKTMTAKTKVVTAIPTTMPIFNREAERHVSELSSLSVEDVGRILRVNPKLAAENVLRYQDFFSESNKALPAILSYTGMVFKRINAADFTDEDFEYGRAPRH